jgi:hypothetical protein
VREFLKYDATVIGALRLPVLYCFWAFFFFWFWFSPVRFLKNENGEGERDERLDLRCLSLGAKDPVLVIRAWNISRINKEPLVFSVRATPAANVSRFLSRKPIKLYLTIPA